MEIIHPFEFKNTHKNITLRYRAQAVSKHFPFTFLQPNQQSSTPLNTVGNITSALRNQDQDLYFVPRKVCFGDACAFLWLWKSAVGVCGSKCVYSWLSPRPQCSGPVGSALKCFCYLNQFTPSLCPKLWAVRATLAAVALTFHCVSASVWGYYFTGEVNTLMVFWGSLCAVR